MIVSRRHGFIFVHVHKTAGEAVTHALAPHLGRGDLVLGGGKLGNLRDLYYRRRHGIDKHSPATRIRAFVGTETWAASTSFAVVRDPVDRMRSLYFYFEKMAAKRRRPGPHNLVYTLPGLRAGDPYGWPGMQAYLGSADFAGFIRHPRLADDPGAHAQLDSLAEGGRLIVTRLVRFERLAEDFAALADDLGLGALALPRVNASRNREPAADPVTPADRAWLEARYAADRTAFGYA